MKIIGESSYMHRFEIGEKMGVPMPYVTQFTKQMGINGFPHFDVIKWIKDKKKIVAFRLERKAIDKKDEKDEIVSEPKIVRVAYYDCRRKRFKQFTEDDEIKLDVITEQTVKIVYKDYWEKLITDVEPFEYVPKDKTEVSSESA